MPNQVHYASGLWKSILSVKSEFDERIRYRVHNGRRVKFWHDVWCGQQALHSLFPNIYLLERRHHAMVADYYHYVGGSIVWDFRFRRNLTDREVSNFTRMLALLDKAYLSIARDDIRLWKPEKHSTIAP